MYLFSTHYYHYNPHKQNCLDVLSTLLLTVADGESFQLTKSD